MKILLEYNKNISYWCPYCMANIRDTTIIRIENTGHCLSCAKDMML